MKKKLVILIMMGNFSSLFAQVGINTDTPLATLDITAKNATGTATNVDGILIPRVDRERAQSMINIPISTMVYINNISTGTQTGTTINVDTEGFYYFNGSIWVKLPASNTTIGSIPSVVASGKANNSFVSNDNEGFVKWTFNSVVNDGNWDINNNTYTTPKAGFYQLSLQGIEKPSGDFNSFDYVLIYNNKSYSFRNITDAQSNIGHNSGGVIVLFLDQNSVLRFGGTPCKDCSGTPNYTISDRSFTITYLGA